jgi:hypothetical protein
VVELLLRQPDGAPWFTRQRAGIGLHGPDPVPVDNQRLAGRPRQRCVTHLIAPSLLQLLEAEVVCNFAAIGMNHLVVAVPDITVSRTLALLDYLVERFQGAGEVVDRDDPAAAAMEHHVADLAGGVAAEDCVLAEL